MFILGFIGYFCVSIVLFNLYFYIKHILSLKDYPDGPFPLPLIGNILMLDQEKPYVSFQKLGKIYGDVFSISFGMDRVVIVNTIEPAREGMVTKAGDFAGRPLDNHTFAMVSRNNVDIALAEYGSQWSMLRKLASKALKIYGDKFDNLEKKITRETEEFNKKLMLKLDTPIDMNIEIRLVIVNVLCNIMFGKRYNNIEDEDFQLLLKAIHYFHEGLSHGDPVSVLPWLRYFPIRSIRMLKKYGFARDKYIQKKYDEHKRNLNPENLTNFLDWLINTSNDEKFIQQGVKQVSRDNIEMIIADMILAGIDTTVVNLLWIILYLLHNPNYIDEAFNEICGVIGKGKYPEINDRSSLHLVQAIIQESLRLTTGPFSLPHKATRDSSLSGKSIKSGTQVLFHMWNIHRDERHWDNPEEFKPTRWFNEEGHFISNMHKSYLPFLMGKRSCIGEQIARAELFLVTTRLLVDFHIERNPGEKLPDISEGTVGIVRYPLPYKVILRKR